MARTRYSHSIDLDNPTTSHTLAILSVRPGSRVLDIGAGDGTVARALVDRGCTVWGIEIDAEAARGAAPFCERVSVGDVEQLDLEATLGTARFDAILLLDVLQHLREPLEILKRSAARLAPGGQIIASIPNVAHGAVRLNLLRGRFAYTDDGLLGRGHLRFFDREAIESLFGEARLEIRERLRVTRGLTETEIPIDPAEFPEQVLSDVARDAESTTYQFVVVAAPASGAGIERAAGSVAELLQRQITGMEGRFREVETRARSVAGELDVCSKALDEARARIAAVESEVEDSRMQSREVASELAERMKELHRNDRDLRYLQSDLAVKDAFLSDLRTELHGRDQELRGVRGDLARAQGVLAAPSVRMVLAIDGRLGRWERLRRSARRLVRFVSARVLP